MIRSVIRHENLKNIRIEQDMTQTSLAEKSGVNLSTIKSVETGRSETSRDKVEKIANALGVDISELWLEDYRWTKVIAVASNKGGCGKTSVAGSLASSLSEIDDNRILLIDGDMQMHLSYSYGMQQDEKNSLLEALIKEDDLQNYIKKTEYPNIDIIIADFKMSKIEMILFTKTLREILITRMLKNTIDSGTYDFIIFDTNPTLGILNYNILHSCDYAIVPVELTAFGLLGLENIIDYIEEVKPANPKLTLLGVLRTKVDRRESLTIDCEKTIHKTFGDKVFKAYISVDANVKKSQMYQLPLSTFMQTSRANMQYQVLAREVLSLVK